LIESFNTSLANISDPKEKQRLQSLHTEKLKRTELTVWLKDFPKTSSDLREMRKSAAQHMPEIDLAVHASILIEEKFKRNYDETEDTIG
jgi:hypothetical protein